MKGQKTQPAIESYFFGQGYHDLGKTIKEVRQLNKEARIKQEKRGTEHSIIHPARWMRLFASLSIMIIGGIITVLTSMVHVSILTVLFLTVYLLFAFVWTADRIYILTNRIRNVCPNPDCQARFLIPAYQCPNPECNSLHDRLMPGRYGILKRKCQCGQKISTTFLNGRGKLKAFCPVCSASLSGDTDQRQYVIPVIGGPSVGKSCYINMTIKKIMKEAEKSSWDIRFLDEESKENYDAAMNQLTSGIRLDKTIFDKLQAYQLMMTFPNDNIGRRIHFYDISGEMFSSDSNLKRNPAFTFADGFIFLIDPLTIGDFEMDVLDKLEGGASAYGASMEDFDDILQLMLNNLDTLLGLSPDKTMEKKLAVVINKCDIPTLEKQIGDTAVKKYMETHPACGGYYDAKNALCRGFLEKYHQDNFIHLAERKFKTVRYFSCSALGHNRQGAAYDGISVEQPFLWLLSQVDSKIKPTIPAL